MKIDVEDIFDKHKDDSCVIVGAGHSMADFDYKNFNGKIIISGSTILRFDKTIEPDYLVTCNNHFPILEISSHLNFLNKFKKMIWLMSDTGCYNDIWEYNPDTFQKVKLDYITYDDRHFGFKNCKPKKNCCKFLKIYKNRKTLFEIIEDKFNTKFTYQDKTGVSVAEHALMFAVLMGFKNIFIQGIDLPTQFYRGFNFNTNKYYGHQSDYATKFMKEALTILRKKYFFYYLKNLNFKPYVKSIIQRIKFFDKKKSFFSENIENSLNIINWLSNIAIQNNTKIYNLSSNSSLKNCKKIINQNFSQIKQSFPQLFNSL